MIELTVDESRVLGVLVEKAQTTPELYPLSLNALVNGANQKNNRDPVVTLDEDRVFAAAEGLRGKGLVIRVDQVGGRVHKYRHNAVETLRVRTAELVLLAELLLRGPQTVGELRGRASRMHPFESTASVTDMLRALMDRPEPFVKQISASPGGRAERYAQLLCPSSHPVETAAAPEREAVPSMASPASSNPSVEQRLEALEAEVAALRASLVSLAEKLGEPV